MLLRKSSLFPYFSILIPLFPILSNTLIIPAVLKMAYGIEQGYVLLAVSIFIGELISCGVLGMILYAGIKKARVFENV